MLVGFNMAPEKWWKTTFLLGWYIPSRKGSHIPPNVEIIIDSKVLNAARECVSLLEGTRNLETAMHVLYKSIGCESKSLHDTAMSRWLANKHSIAYFSWEIQRKITMTSLHSLIAPGCNRHTFWGSGISPGGFFPGRSKNWYPWKQWQPILGKLLKNSKTWMESPSFCRGHPRIQSPTHLFGKNQPSGLLGRDEVCQQKTRS